MARCVSLLECEVQGSKTLCERKMCNVLLAPYLTPSWLNTCTLAKHPFSEVFKGLSFHPFPQMLPTDKSFGVWGLLDCDLGADGQLRTHTELAKLKQG